MLTEHGAHHERQHPRREHFSTKAGGSMRNVDAAGQHGAQGPARHTEQNHERAHDAPLQISSHQHHCGADAAQSDRSPFHAARPFTESPGPQRRGQRHDADQCHSRPGTHPVFGDGHAAVANHEQQKAHECGASPLSGGRHRPPAKALPAQQQSACQHEARPDQEKGWGALDPHLDREVRRAPNDIDRQQARGNEPGRGLRRKLLVRVGRHGADRCAHTCRCPNGIRTVRFTVASTTLDCMSRTFGTLISFLRTTLLNASKSSP
jgi:hypothetical protein